MEEDWNSVSDNRPTFSLFTKRSPEEVAKNNTFVDVITYNRWSKAERRLYQRLKTQMIVKQIEEEQLKSMDDIVSSLDSLRLIQAEPQHDPQIDDLIGTLENMKLKADSFAPKMEKPFKTK